jgi:hypothetical protein
VLLLVGVLGTGAATACIALYDPLLALGAVTFVILALATISRPDFATFAVIFILYSNLAVVASRFHGVPRLVASAFPLLLAAPLIRDLILRRQRVVVTPALPFLFFLLIVQIVSMMFSRDLEVTRAVVIEFVFEGLLVYFLITNVVKTPRSLRLAVWALLLAGFVSAVVPCYQQVTGSFDNNFAGLGQTSEVGFRTGEFTGRGEVRQIRVAGPIGEQNRYAQNMLMLLPLGLFAFFGERSKTLRFLALFFTAVTGAGFLLSFSRGGAVAFVLVLMVMVLMRTVTLRQLAVVGLVAALGLAAMPQYWARLKTIGDLPGLFSRAGVSSQTGSGKPDSAAQRRFIEMAAAGMVFADHPVIGVGPGMFKYYSQEYGNRLGIRKITETRKAHSLYLEVAAEGGVLGLISFFGAVLVTLHGLIFARRRLLQGPRGATSSEEHERVTLANLVTGLLLALIAYLGCAVFLHLAYIRFFYLMMGLAAAASGVALAFSSRGLPPAPALEPGVDGGEA